MSYMLRYMSWINVVHTMPSILEQSQAYARVLFVDFSSAFSPMPYWRNWNITWYHSFLTGRSQLVRVNWAHSLSLTTNTGASQGCVSSPLLCNSTQTTVHPQPLEASLSNLQTTLQSPASCLPIATLTGTSPRWVERWTDNFLELN